MSTTATAPPILSDSIDLYTADAASTSVRRADRGRCEIVARLRKVIFLDNLTGSLIAATDCPAEGGEVVVRGSIPIGSVELDPGCEYKWYGKWAHHDTYGDQFQFSTFTLSMPPTKEGVIRYLSRLAPKVGRIRAAKLWDAFGAQAVEMLRTNPQAVADTEILSHEDAVEAATVLFKNCKREDAKIALDGLLGGRGFPGKIIPACLEEYGESAPDVIRANTFKLMVDELPGAGFKRCDRLWLDLELDPAALERQMWAAWHSMRSDTKGHTWNVSGVARKAVIGAVGKSKSQFDEAIALGKKMRRIATREDEKGAEWLAEWDKAQAELRVARHLIRLWKPHDIADGTVQTLWPSRQDLAESTPQLTPHQLDELSKFAASPVGILAGTPGTGKTFSAAALLKLLCERIGEHQIRVVAPTGKAAVRITEAMRRYGIGLQATTIHRLLAVGPQGFQFNESNQLAVRIVAVDETSMLDTSLAASLLSALPDGCHLLLIGDPYQLAPVGHGAPLRDMIAANVPCGLLTEIQRNAGMIVQACAAIKDGKRIQTAEKYNPATGENLRWFECESPVEQIETLRRIVQGIHAGDKFDATWDVQVLCARNKQTPVSRVELNKLLQGILNAETGPTMVNGVVQTPDRRLHPYRVGDKIICLKNVLLKLYDLPSAESGRGLAPDEVSSYEQIVSEDGVPKEGFVANGEIGRVLAIDVKMVVARFEEPARIAKIPVGKEPREGEDVASEENESASSDGEGKSDGGKSGGANDFALAYAITTHKAQGSEARCVIVLVDDMAGFVASREFHYTAISRAKDLCLVIGRRATFDRQCRRVALKDRKTFLVETLKEVIEGEL